MQLDGAHARQLFAISFGGISREWGNAMKDLINTIVALIKRELEKPEWRQDVLRPLTRWIALGILPYVLGIICLNFFLTIAAVSLVLYMSRRT
jgi:hypothetical protein